MRGACRLQGLKPWLVTWLVGSESPAPRAGCPTGSASHTRYIRYRLPDGDRRDIRYIRYTRYIRYRLPDGIGGIGLRKGSLKDMLAGSREAPAGQRAPQDDDEQWHGLAKPAEKGDDALSA